VFIAQDLTVEGNIQGFLRNSNSPEGLADTAEGWYYKYSTQIAGAIMLSLRMFISGQRHSAVARTMAGGCRRIVRWTENFNFEHDTNGEARILSAVSGLNLQTVFDVGANTGTWSALARGAFPQAKIHCFEIVAETAARLRAATRNDNAVIVNAFGLADAEREIPVRFFPTATGLSTTLVDFPHSIPDKVITGRVVPGDAYLHSHGLSGIDFLKIDVEGNEGLVLRGFERSIADRRIAVIQFEYGAANIYSRFLLHDLYVFLRGHGYRVGKIYPRGVEFREYRPDHEDFIGSNYLAVLVDREDVMALVRHP
jgi:FkbM family methyltransferase